MILRPAQKGFLKIDNFELFSKQQERYRLYGKFVKSICRYILFLAITYTKKNIGSNKIEFFKIIKTKPHKLNSETFIIP